eukprot:snap_masked-scaffold_6-processed-gene-17.20-mRNA-1 protein AED:1.00 eAED:1.00 QI:0/-1/0/0/-1/1/1/0/778
MKRTAQKTRIPDVYCRFPLSSTVTLLSNFARMKSKLMLNSENEKESVVTQYISEFRVVFVELSKSLSTELRYLHSMVLVQNSVGHQSSEACIIKLNQIRDFLLDFLEALLSMLSGELAEEKRSETADAVASRLISFIIHIRRTFNLCAQKVSCLESLFRRIGEKYMNLQESMQNLIRLTRKIAFGLAKPELVREGYTYSGVHAQLENMQQLLNENYDVSILDFEREEALKKDPLKLRKTTENLKPDDHAQAIQPRKSETLITIETFIACLNSLEITNLVGLFSDHLVQQVADGSGKLARRCTSPIQRILGAVLPVLGKKDILRLNSLVTPFYEKLTESVDGFEESECYPANSKIESLLLQEKGKASNVATQTELLEEETATSGLKESKSNRIGFLPWTKLLKARNKVKGKRFDVLLLQNNLIGQILMKKLMVLSEELNRSDTGFYKIQPLAKFVNHYFTQKYGLKKIADENMLGLVQAIHENELSKEKSPRISLFGALLGIVDAPNYNEMRGNVVLFALLHVFKDGLGKVASAFSQSKPYISAEVAESALGATLFSLPTINTSSKKVQQLSKRKSTRKILETNKAGGCWSVPSSFTDRVEEWVEENSNKEDLVPLDDFLWLMYSIANCKQALDYMIFENLFVLFDLDGNGVLSFDEFETLLKGSEGTSRTLFLVKNGSFTEVNLLKEGSMSQDEFDRIKYALGDPLGRDEILDLWDEVNKEEEDDDLEHIEKSSFANVCLRKGIQIPYWKLCITLDKNLNEPPVCFNETGRELVLESI